VSSPQAARVLLIGDDTDVTDIFSQRLRLQGFEVWAATSSRLGLNLAHIHGPHAVILAIRVPLASSLRILQALRAIPALADTQVAIVTGDHYQQDGDVSEARRLGAVIRYQPIWLDELVSLARDLVQTGSRPMTGPLTQRTPPSG
jgi:DNA-binding response OmpR family regulator